MERPWDNLLFDRLANSVGEEHLEQGVPLKTAAWSTVRAVPTTLVREEFEVAADHFKACARNERESKCS